MRRKLKQIKPFAFLVAVSRCSLFSLYFQQHANPANFDTSGKAWVVLNEIEVGIKAKIEAAGIPLKEWDVQINYGIKTGYNDAFIIDGDTKDRLLKASPKSAEIIRPILRGRDVKPYLAQFANRWIIFTRHGIDIKQHPAVEQHLLSYYDELKPKKSGDKTGRKPGTYKWYEIQDNVAYYQDFSKEKITWIELTDQPKFALDTEGYFLNNSVFFMTGIHLRYLAGFLNSKLCEWYFDKLAASSGVGTRRWFKVYVEQLAVPQISIEQQEPITKLVDEAVMANTEASRRHELKQLIDIEVFRLFSLTNAEINFIKSQ
jgi:hypothetical protein